MENVVREVNSELFEFVAKNVYETYQYLVSMEEVLEYVKLVMVDLAEKKIKVVKQGEVIDMVSKLIINDTKKLVSDTEFEPSKKKFNNNVVSDDRYALVFKSAYSNLNEDEQMIINNVMLNGILNEDEKTEYLSAVMKLVSIILEDDAYVANIVLYKMLNKGYCKGRSK